MTTKFLHCIIFVYGVTTTAATPQLHSGVFGAGTRVVRGAGQRFDDVMYGITQTACIGLAYSPLRGATRSLVRVVRVGDGWSFPCSLATPPATSINSHSNGDAGGVAAFPCGHGRPDASIGVRAAWTIRAWSAVLAVPLAMASRCAVY